MTMSLPEGSPFDALRHLDSEGEHWFARELMVLMGYSRWEDFAAMVERAKASLALVQGAEAADHHFAIFRSDGGRWGKTKVEDYRLTRFAAYLTAMAADDTKTKVAEARIYFAVKTREAEVAERLGDPLDELEASNARMAKAIEIARSERAARVEAEEKVKELEPKAASYDVFLSTDGTQRMDIVAKEFGMSGVKLFAILRDEAVLMEGGRRQNVPYAQHAKHFKVVAQTYETNTRGTQATSTTYVRPSGYEVIRQVLDRRARRVAIEQGHQRELGGAS